MSTDKNPEDKRAGFDMYRFFSRWDIIMLVAFLIAFLIFSAAIFMYPQPV